MQRTVRQATCSAQVPLTYRCSKCGEINVFTKVITGEASYQVGLFTNREQKDREIGEQASQALEKYRSDFKNALNNRKYRGLGVSHRCEKCGNIEPWGKVDMRHMPKLYFAGIIGAAVAVFSYCAGSYGAVIWLGVFLALLLACFMIEKINEWRCEEKVSALRSDNLPMPVSSPEELSEIYSRPWTRSEPVVNKKRICIFAVFGVLAAIILIILMSCLYQYKKHDVLVGTEFSQSLADGKNTYVQLNSVDPTYCTVDRISKQAYQFILAGETLDQETVWIAVNIDDYVQYIDPTQDADVLKKNLEKSARASNALWSNVTSSADDVSIKLPEKVTFKTPVTIQGYVKKAEEVCDGLEEEIEKEKVIVFSKLQ